jgi:hypothetical protein
MPDWSQILERVEDTSKFVTNMSIHIVSAGLNALTDLQDALIAYEVVFVHAVPQIHYEPTKPLNLARIQRLVTRLAEKYPLVHFVKIEIEGDRAALRIEGDGPVYPISTGRARPGPMHAYKIS